MNIVLIGMPGCGKSTVGVVLAKAEGMHFCDTDLVIQQRQERKLQEIINTAGIEAFLRCEEEALLSICCEDTVIATGGSAVYSDRAMRWLKKNAVTVYLRAEAREIAFRLANLKDRGVAIGRGMSIYDLYRERAPLYERYADIVVDERGASIPKTVEKLSALLAPYRTAGRQMEC